MTEVLALLRRKPGAKTTPRNIAAWLGLPVGDVRRELGRLEDEGLAESLQTHPGRERFWVIREGGDL